MDATIVKELFNYNAATGKLYWAADIPRHHFDSDKGYKVVNGRNAGKEAGTEHPSGYLHVRWKNKAYMLHRVIWLWVYGVWPSKHIDHIDHCRSNNRLQNLRDIPKEHNNAHKKNNKSGYSGIFENKRNTNRPWMVQVFTKGKFVTQKSFADLQDAVAHRDEIRRQYGLSQL